MNKDDDVFPTRHPDTDQADSRLWNWAQNSSLGQREAVRQPENQSQLQEIIAGSRGHINILGSRYSPGRMLRVQDPDDILLDAGLLRGLIGTADDTATFAGATPLQDVYDTLTGLGRMLPSSPGVIAAQTLAGAMATGTHGQGLYQSSIADEAVNIRIMLADGSIEEFAADHPYFGAVQVSLGALGVILEVTLRTVPLGIYTCYKNACSADDLSSSLTQWNQDFALSKAWWFPEDNQVHVWNARQATQEEVQLWQDNGRQIVNYSAGNDTLNTTIDQTLQHMQNDTRIKDEHGKPFKTVTRFKDFSDVIGDVYQVFCRGIATPQINIEIGIPLSRAPEVIEKIRQWHALTHPHMHYPIILRCTGASSAWLSPAYGEATCFFGFVVYYAEDGTLSPDGMHFLSEVEKLLAKEGGRPHWGKYYRRGLYQWSDIYPKWDSFLQVRHHLDPEGKFSNRFVGDILS
ncbi:D-arabinono-1,4-lactone oxidase [Biostraticola tofi]|uniref:FAD/FMN-containing dehydrogenase n=1 Tax=Biostraticola tofi TaxID=466109 RepID=A0A4V2W4B7_9GAMM|nr:D-arabinono-1,4-lactone oxidase [Biostraticola tofi]TCV95219.1 FAD/FMN-containing dehydrogenase [Biostraticola tofi]